MFSNLTEKDLEKVMKENPKIGRYGFEFDEKISKLPDNKKINFNEFKKCVIWMEKNLSSRPLRSKLGCGSYGIKHLAEQDLGGYISNGAAIAAGFFLKLPILNYKGPNVNFRVKSRAEQTMGLVSFFE